MKKALLTLFVITTILFTFSFSLTVKVGIYDNPPITFYEDGVAQGILVNVFNYIAQKENWQLSYVYDSFFTLLNELKDGKIDMLLGVVQTEERSKLYNFSKEYILFNWAQVYKRMRSPILSPLDLKGKRVGVLKSDVFYEGKLGIKYFLDHLGIRAKFVEFSSYSDIFKAIEERKIDAGVVNRFFGSVNASKYDLEEAPIVFSPIEEKVAFSKQSAITSTIEPVLDKYIKQMKVNENSALNTSVGKYLSQTSGKFTFPKWVFYALFGAIIAFLILLANIIILRKLVKKETGEIEKKSKKLRESNEELMASNEEIRAMNEELENAYIKLGKLTSRFRSMVVLLSQLDALKVKEKEFLGQMLDMALEMIPSAKYGSVWVLDKGKWRIVAVKGHDEKILKDPNVDWKLIPLDKPRIVDFSKENRKFTSMDVLERFEKATKPIKESLCAPLIFSNETLGRISVDIPKGSKESFTKDEVETLNSFAKIATAFYVSRRYLKLHQELQDRLTLVFVKALEKYDVYTKGHSERVAKCSVNLAKTLGLDEELQRRIYQSGLLHDVGKMFVPVDILTKNGKLTVEEYEQIKKHTTIGAELIEEGAELKDISMIVRHHHERWDGKGYPDGLKGEEIPLEARIMAVCDTYDAMTSDRPYRKALSQEVALKEIEKNAGKQFDPTVAKAFLEIMYKI